MKNFFVIYLILFAMLTACSQKASESSSTFQSVDAGAPSSPAEPDSEPTEETPIVFRYKFVADNIYNAQAARISVAAVTNEGEADEDYAEFDTTVTTSHELMVFGRNVNYGLINFGQGTSRVKVYRSSPPYDTDELIAEYLMIYQGSPTGQQGNDNM